MQVRVLGCSGAIAQDCRTTSFLIDGRILIDAGTGVGDLRLNEMLAIDDVLLTHSHLDHVAALPLMLDAIASLRTQPLRVHALPETIDALKKHIFNNVIWPDFGRIPSASAPFVRYVPLQTGQTLHIAGTTIEVLPARHTVPAVGYAALGASGWWAFSGDTGPNPALWQRLNAMDVALLVLETAFSSQEHELAQRSLHLSPQTLVHELAQWRPQRPCPVYITHTKPLETDRILDEIHRLDMGSGGAPLAHSVFWLQAGQEFAV